MANTYFSQYIDDIDTVIKEARIKHDLAFIALENAQEANKKAQLDQNISHHRKAIVAAQLREAEDEHRKTLNSLQVEAESSIKTLRRSFEKHIAEYSVADPSKVDQSTVMLLNSGAMRDTDLVALANKFWNNPTMLKLIMAESDKNLTDSKIARYLSVRIAHHLSPTYRLSIFDSAAEVAMRTIHPRASLARMHQKDWAETFFNEYRAAMAQTDTFRMEVV